MGTFRESIKTALVERGMSERQADQVIEKAKDDPALKDFSSRWNEDTSEYPGVMLNVLWTGVKTIALKWIDTNLPKAWYRPMFQ